MKLKKIILKEEPNWYFKAIGMLQHNYAFIHEVSEEKAIVYFCHENGTLLNESPNKIKWSEVSEEENFPCIVDSLEFPNTVIADFQLRTNHFSFISEEGPESNFDLDGCPTGNKFFDMREYQSGIYSKQNKYWNHMDELLFEYYYAIWFEKKNSESNEIIDDEKY
jgi:hypothetical protein